MPRSIHYSLTGLIFSCLLISPFVYAYEEYYVEEEPVYVYESDYNDIDNYAPYQEVRRPHKRSMRRSAEMEMEMETDDDYAPPRSRRGAPLPSSIKTAEKVILIDPNVHAWGAYTADGKLVRWGVATAGANWCRDIERPCRTKAGSFRIYSLGDESCYSTKFPVPDGGAPMPYCMYFNGGQALHGSNEVVYANVSHGCVRLHVGEARWLRYNFVESPNSSNGFRGTKVMVRGY